jgi:hypothetical protein
MKTIVNNAEEVVRYFCTEFDYQWAEQFLGIQFSDADGKFPEEEGFDDEKDYGDTWRESSGIGTMGFPEQYPCLIVESEEYNEITYVYLSDFPKPKSPEVPDETENPKDDIWNFGNFESLCK